MCLETVLMALTLLLLLLVLLLLLLLLLLLILLLLPLLLHMNNAVFGFAQPQSCSSHIYNKGGALTGPAVSTRSGTYTGAARSCRSGSACRAMMRRHYVSRAGGAWCHLCLAVVISGPCTI